MANGGKRPGSGRKPKADEVALIERLSPMDDSALKSLLEGVKKGEFSFIKLFMEYRYGRPKEKIEHSGELAVLWNEIKNYGANDKTDEGS